MLKLYLFYVKGVLHTDYLIYKSNLHLSILFSIAIDSIRDKLILVNFDFKISFLQFNLEVLKHKIEINSKKNKLLLQHEKISYKSNSHLSVTFLRHSNLVHSNLANCTLAK